MYSIGVDLGGTNIKAGIVDENGKILAKSSIPTIKERVAELVIDDMAGQIKKLIADNKIEYGDILGIGVGSPGAINSADGVVDYSNNLNWSDVHLAEQLNKFINLPVMVSNDANVAALGETLFGVGKKYSSTVLITLGTGVGGGIVLDNKLFEGNQSKGAELGHTVLEVGGEECTCGRRGCWEAYSSATALIRDTKRAMEANPDSSMWEEVSGDLDRVSGKTAFDCAKKGDMSAKMVVDKYILYLAEGITNFANILRPQAIILGGGVCAQGDYLLKPVKEYVEKYKYGFQNSPVVDILIAALGNDAGIVGAASLIFTNKKSAASI